MGRKKESSDYTVTLHPPSSDGDSDITWGQPVQVSTHSVPRRSHNRKPIWDDLFTDVCLRLEQTTARYALAYPFENFLIATRAYNALYYRFNRVRGPKAVHMNVLKEPPVLYVRRGPNW